MKAYVSLAILVRPLCLTVIPSVEAVLRQLPPHDLFLSSSLTKSSSG